jgi:hypothetical protein
MRTVYKVQELLHVFLNGKAMIGQRAGKYITTKNGVMCKQSRPIAAFVKNATSDKGLPVVVHMSNDVWTPYVIENAAPPSIYPVRLHLQHWDTASDIVGLCDDYLRSLEGLLARTAASARDDNGDAYIGDTYKQQLRALNTLLSLTWHDPMAQQRARTKLEEHRREWFVSPEGVIDTRVARAIAQRKHISSDGAKGFSVLSRIAAEWKDKNDKQRVALSLSLQYEFEDALAKAARYGFREIDKSLRTMCEEFGSYVARGEKRRARWKAYAALRRVENFEHTGLSDADLALLPRGAAERHRIATDLRLRLDRRANIKRRLQNAIDTVARARNDAARFPAIIKRVATMSADELNDVEYPTRRYEAHSAMDTVGSIMKNRPFDDGLLDTLLALDDELRNAIGARRAALREQSDAERKAERRAWVIENMRLKPRAALKVIRDEGFDELRVGCEAQCEVVTDFQEWCNGGAKPILGDWLRRVGNRAVTSRNAEVPLRAAKAALAYVDAQPDGPFSADFGIGAFTLTGRNNEGVVIVGCHQFSPAAIEAFREQIADTCEV